MNLCRGLQTEVKFFFFFFSLMKMQESWFVGAARCQKLRRIQLQELPKFFARVYIYSKFQRCNVKKLARAYGTENF